MNGKSSRTNDSEIGWSSSAVMELRGITKQYPGVTALDAVDFVVNRKEVLGLVGENGAGKSTLMKIIVGLAQPDLGTITLRGEPVTISDPQWAVRKGIGMVFQEGSLVPNLTVMENLFLCHEKGFGKFGFLSRREMRRTARELLEQIGVTVDVDAAIPDLTAGTRQMVEIARLLWLSNLYGQTNPVLVLDEPTTVLSDQERDTLFSILPRLKERASIIFISHRLQEIVEHSDRIVILKDGKNVTEASPSELQVADIEQLMVGHGFSSDRFREHEQRGATEEEVLRVENLTRRGVFESVSFSVKRGEIVSLVGLVGSGKEEVCRCINGLDRYDSGSTFVRGRRLANGSPDDAVRFGIGHIPIDRRSDGLALDMSVAANVNLLVLNRMKVAGFLSPARERANALKWIEECRIKTPSATTRCATLSGGNQQKTVISKWLSSDALVLVLDHPTRGVDVGAKDEIYRIMRKLSADGIAMIIMCDTLEEDIGLCDRMLIMKDGRLVNEVSCPPEAKPEPGDIINYIV